MNYVAAAGKSYSSAISFDASPGRLVFISGQLGVGAGEAAQRFEDEARVCFDNVSAALRACGADLEDVVRIDVFLTDLANYSDFTRIRGEIFSSNPPTSTAVQVSGLLKDARIEVSAVAFSQADEKNRSA